MRAQCLIFIASLLCSWETSPRFSGTFLARCALTLRGGGTNARPWPPASHGLVDGSAFQQLDLRLPSGVQRALVDWQRRGLPPPTLRLSLGGADFLHLGHARAALLKDYIAKSCNGSLVVRFEDMDCSVLPEAEDAVLQELALLGIKVDRTARASDNADVLMAACERSIREGRAYVDELRRDTVMGCNPLLPESACRGSSTSENLARWSEMVAGSGAYCVRARLNLSSSLPILHDPVLFYSTSSSPSSAGETQLHCQPSATFSVPVLDHALGVSFVLLSSHPRGRDEQYRAMCAIAGIPPPPELRLVDHVSCLSDAPLNTLMLQRLMLGGGVKGCHDLSLPTVRGLLHQGLQPAALRVFALLSSGLGQQRGHKGVNVCMTAPGVVEESVLWKINKQMLVDRGECERFTVLDSASMCKMMLRGCVDLDTNVSTGESEDGETMQTVLLEEFDAASVREGDKISLLNWPSAGTARSGARVGHFRVIGMQFDAQGNTVRLLGELMSQNPDLETTKSFCWLPDPDPPVGRDVQRDPRTGAHMDLAKASRLTKIALKYATPVRVRWRAGRSGEKPEQEDVNSRHQVSGSTDADHCSGYWLDEGFDYCANHGGGKPESLAQHVQDWRVLGAEQRLVDAVGEEAMVHLKAGDVIELNRKGFFVVDAPVDGEGCKMTGGNMQLIAIPSGMVVRRYLDNSDSDNSEDYEDVGEQAAAEDDEIGQLQTDQSAISTGLFSHLS